jgi:hypothetical protein
MIPLSFAEYSAMTAGADLVAPGSGAVEADTAQLASDNDEGVRLILADSGSRRR